MWESKCGNLEAVVVTGMFIEDRCERVRIRFLGHLCGHEANAELGEMPFGKRFHGGV